MSFDKIVDAMCDKVAQDVEGYKTDGMRDVAALYRYMTDENRPFTDTAYWLTRNNGTELGMADSRMETSSLYGYVMSNENSILERANNEHCYMLNLDVDASTRIVELDPKEFIEIVKTCGERTQENAEKNAENVKEWLKEQISELTYGKMSEEVAPSSYYDRFSADTVLKIFNEYQELSQEAKAECSFKDYLYNELDNRLYENDAHFDIEKELVDKIKERTEFKDEAFQEAFEQATNEMSVSEILEFGGYEGTDSDIEGFLENDYHINLMFATPNERNLDMGGIMSFYNPDVADMSKHIYEDMARFNEYSDNALTYLIHQQGHTMAEVFEDLHGKGDKKDPQGFIESVTQELYNEGYSMAELTALVSASGKDLVNLLDNVAKGEGFITLPKETEIGLFNEWNGAGSVLEIQLEKDVVIPCDMVRNLQMEGAGKENNGYTVDSVYGMVGSVWTKSEPKITTERPVMIGENFEMARDVLKDYAKKANNEKTKGNDGFER